MDQHVPVLYYHVHSNWCNKQRYESITVHQMDLLLDSNEEDVCLTTLCLSLHLYSSPSFISLCRIVYVHEKKTQRMYQCYLYKYILHFLASQHTVNSGLARYASYVVIYITTLLRNRYIYVLL